MKANNIICYLSIVWLLASCVPPPPPAQSSQGILPPAQLEATDVPMPTNQLVVATNTAVLPSNTSSIDLTHLPLGDGRLATSPTIGWIWPCRTDPTAGGAFTDGPWIRDDDTYDYTAKAVVDGAVTWQNHFVMEIQGDQRVFTSNDLPNHPTGSFPIAQTDDAYQYDRNPNSIANQTIQIALPANPTLAAQPTCVPGAIGILLTGSVLFNALDAPGRDAVAHETQDGCQGHPQEFGVYHYHNLSDCLPDTPSSDGHSALMGYILDGFGLYGHHGENGRTLTSADLDECHGHTHPVEWDGQLVEMYHYHATWDFPYTVGCIRGTVETADMMAISGGSAGSQEPQGQPPAPPQPGHPPPGQNRPGG